MLSDIFDLYRNGEIIPFIILALLCVGYIIILEKFLILQLVYNINFVKFNAQIKKMLVAGDLDRARSYSKAVSATGAPMITTKAIEAFEFDPTKVRPTISEESMRFLPRIRRRLSQLPNLAAAAVIIGALATVHGIWESFKMVEGLELSIKSFVFSSSLTHAMLPIGISLMGAFLLMLPFGILEAIASRIEAELEHTVCVVINILAPDIQTVYAPSISSGESLPVKSESSNLTEKPAEDLPTQKAANNAQDNPTPNSIPDEEEII